jgi:amino-acid N-acetyltransferase
LLDRWARVPRKKFSPEPRPDVITVRKAEPADYARITQLLTDAALPLEGLAGHENFLVLSRKGRVVGCAAIERYGKCGLLRSVALDPNERRHGFGRHLVQEALQQARRDALSELVLFTTTAAPFFERLGFRTISREEVPAPVRASVEFQSACPATAAVLHRVL